MVEIISKILEILFIIEIESFNPKSEELQLKISENFINCCLNSLNKAQTYPHDFKEFYLIFYRFAKLSQKTVIYLMEKQFIGRFFNSFFEINIYFEETLNSSIHFEENINNNLVFPLKEKRKKKLNQKNNQLKKKEKFFCERFSSNNRVHIWQTIAYLMSHCRIDKNHKQFKSLLIFVLNLFIFYRVSCLNLRLNKNENNLCTLDKKSIQKIIEDGSLKISVRSISYILSFLSYENLRFSIELIDAICNGLDERKSSEFRPYFACIKKSLTLNDSLKQRRVLF